MGMLRLVRAYTGREPIIKFDGCYHGHADSFLVQAGSGVATLGLPDSPGKSYSYSIISIYVTNNTLNVCTAIPKSLFSPRNPSTL